MVNAFWRWRLRAWSAYYNVMHSFKWLSQHSDHPLVMCLSLIVAALIAAAWVVLLVNAGL